MVLFRKEIGGYLLVALSFQSTGLVSFHLILLLLCNLLGRVVLLVIQIKSQFLVLFQFTSAVVVCRYSYLKKVNSPHEKKAKPRQETNLEIVFSLNEQHIMVRFVQVLPSTYSPCIWQARQGFPLWLKNPCCVLCHSCNLIRVSQRVFCLEKVKMELVCDDGFSLIALESGWNCCMVLNPEYT